MAAAGDIGQKLVGWVGARDGQWMQPTRVTRPRRDVLKSCITADHLCATDVPRLLISAVSETLISRDVAEVS
jgi:hypothetical protein